MYDPLKRNTGEHLFGAFIKSARHGGVVGAFTYFGLELTNRLTSANIDELRYTGLALLAPTFIGFAARAIMFNFDYHDAPAIYRPSRRGGFQDKLLSALRQ